MHHEWRSLGLVHQNLLKIVWYTKYTHSTDRPAFCHWYQFASLLSILVWVILSIQNKTVIPISQKDIPQTQKGKLYTEFLCGVWAFLVSVECIHWNIITLAASFHRKLGSSSSKKFPSHSQTRCMTYHVILFSCTLHEKIQGLLTKYLLYHLEYYHLISYLLATHCHFPKAFLTLFPL